MSGKKEILVRRGGRGRLSNLGRGDVVKEIVVEDATGDEASPADHSKTVVLLCSGVVVLAFVLGWTMRLILLGVGILRPVLLTSSAMSRKKPEVEGRWMLYWMFCGLFFLAETAWVHNVRYAFLFTATEIAILFLLSQNEARNSELIYSWVLSPVTEEFKFHVETVTCKCSSYVDQVWSAFSEVTIGSAKAFFRSLARSSRTVSDRLDQATG
ncbi:hypothetical protein NDN08_000907 [Rhodosorus marinus]|uniref:Receptor expression-enhancing protein n=1 Tax=Rhodosorus marinus TaxID=101924 RepID=A0AAV8UTJ7_9RHOD|nr:hypothetical protein NDN08_000907 [Rhodosorus marinus]